MWGVKKCRPQYRFSIESVFEITLPMYILLFDVLFLMVRSFIALKQVSEYDWAHDSYKYFNVSILIGLHYVIPIEVMNRSFSEN
jgi:hypothetical protein